MFQAPQDSLRRVVHEVDTEPSSMLRCSTDQHAFDRLLKGRCGFVWADTPVHAIQCPRGIVLVNLFSLSREHGNLTGRCLGS